MKRTVLYAAITIVAVLCAVFSGCMTIGTNEKADLAEGTDYEKAGDITVRMRVWNTLFLKTPAERAAVLVNAAEEKVRDDFGSEAILVNPELSSRWSVFSLILAFDLLGFVEDATLTAEVLVPSPPPPSPPSPPPEPEKAVRISYPILPRDRYDDEYGYIALEYQTRPEVLEKIKLRLDKRDARAGEYETEYSRVPPGGHLIVNIGRKDLMHANTRWYDYTVIEDGNTIVQKRGTEGIPNIKGRDGNWWNEVIIPLKAPIENSVEVRITDTKLGVLYAFTVTRSEEVM